MDHDIEEAARRHGLSPAAADTLFRALIAGGGFQAQFSHPELGGMGQWSGGMTQIGDMFNDALKAKVGGFCQDMATSAQQARQGSGSTDSDAGEDLGRSLFPDRPSWWPDTLGSPTSSGAQNGMRYACFPDSRRLAVERDGRVSLYDTGTHRLTGFSQQQGGTTDLTFSGPDGPVALDSLKAVAW